MMTDNFIRIFFAIYGDIIEALNITEFDIS